MFRRWCSFSLRKYLERILLNTRQRATRTKHRECADHTVLIAERLPLESCQRTQYSCLVLVQTKPLWAPALQLASLGRLQRHPSQRAM